MFNAVIQVYNRVTVIENNILTLTNANLIDVNEQ